MDGETWQRPSYCTQSAKWALSSAARDSNGLLTLNELAAYVHDVLEPRWGKRYASEQSGRGWVDIRLFEAPGAVTGR